MASLRPGLGISWKLEYDCHVAQCCYHSCWVPVIHAVSHVDHEKRVAWFSTISVHTCGSVPIGLGSPFGLRTSFVNLAQYGLLQVVHRSKFSWVEFFIACTQQKCLDTK